MGTMDKILILIGVVLLVFTGLMVWVFLIYGTIPDTLVTCVFAVCGGECGAMSWIKTNKDKLQERQWQEEDIKRAEKAQSEEERAN